MSDELLLDSHTLLWLDIKLPMKIEAEFAIARAAALDRLYVCDISIWELGLAAHKKSLERRPDLRGLSFEEWFTETTGRIGTRGLRISEAIAREAAEVPAIYGSGDPGDCFLIAAARIHGCSLVTRDAKMIKLATRLPRYLSVISC